ncbi:hypothetical protein [Planococcus salinus]|uniref:Aerobactin siderophore biosynthesis IucA/IucC-like C-terminal domain-containing protein n=1 Tax=Planococcus salinus TaxID=1848460 RepID=A0A3M8P8W5_9BACL|nr:hypothetical protein [Planococcus salinus]RNF40146.1 hypothetical protein EEX84_05775 [Planococcus salinus]
MKELELFQVNAHEDPDGFMTVAESMEVRNTDLLNHIIQTTEAPSEAVASSIFMRRFGFFITAQLYLLAQGKMWDGSLQNIHLVDTPGGISFDVDARLIRERLDGDLEAVLKNYGLPVVEAFRKAGHVSKLILWENIWGYVIWMYGMQNSKQAEQDVEALLDAAIWQPEMRKSFFRQFLGGRDFDEAKAEYQRITCCLYKELPGTDKCPYCPQKK